MKAAKQERNEIIEEMIEGLRTAGEDDLLNAVVDHLLDARTEEQARQILTDIGEDNTSPS
jgi:hypothetical protein